MKAGQTIKNNQTGEMLTILVSEERRTRTHPHRNQTRRRTCRAFQLAYGVANDGAAAKDGLPRNLLDRLLFIRTAEGFLPQVPLIVQKFVLSVAAFLAKVTGVDKRLAKYQE